MIAHARNLVSEVGGNSDRIQCAMTSHRSLNQQLILNHRDTEKKFRKRLFGQTYLNFLIGWASVLKITLRKSSVSVGEKSR